MNQDERHDALLAAGIGPECATWDKTYAPCPACGKDLYCAHCEWCKSCGTVLDLRYDPDTDGDMPDLDTAADDYYRIDPCAADSGDYRPCPWCHQQDTYCSRCSSCLGCGTLDQGIPWRHAMRLLREAETCPWEFQNMPFRDEELT